MELKAQTIAVKPAPLIPKPVVQVCRRLTDEGFRAWLAGGCVRDMLLGRKARDWDIVTNAPLEKLRETFPDHIDVGVSFGILKLPPAGSKAEPVQIDIAIFRKEEGYSDRRHPDKVEIGDEQTDVARRDFTCNALYFDPATAEIIDFVGGHKDIASKVIRSVGLPEKRFSEDALRILRAVRFTAQLGFKVERETAAGLKKSGPLLREISRERIREEVFRMLTTPRPVVGLETLMQNGLWETVFGVRKLALPADMRQLKLSWKPTPLHWLCAFGVTGLIGDPINEPKPTVERLTDLLKLSNQENRILSRAMGVYNDAVGPTEHPPGDWVELAREDRQLIDLLKVFIRRARGPTEEQKTKAIALLEQSLRWAAKPGSEKSWPSAEALMKEGLKGPKLGKELKTRQWAAFWARKP